MILIPLIIYSIFICLTNGFDSSQKYKRETALLLPGINVASLEYKPKLLTGDSEIFANLFGVTEHLNGSVGYVQHKINDTNYQGITIELNSTYDINHLRIRLWDVDTRDYSYYVEVSANLKIWTKVIDHSQLPCRSWQYLYFPSQIIKYIRVVGTKNTVNWNFHVVSLKAFYWENSFN
jgi:BTB/POZ domain-containing protein 9